MGSPATVGLPVVCSPLVCDLTSICLGSLDMVEIGNEVQMIGNFDRLGRRCREEEEVGDLRVDRHAPLNSYASISGGASGYSDWVI